MPLPLPPQAVDESNPYAEIDLNPEVGHDYARATSQEAVQYDNMEGLTLQGDITASSSVEEVCSVLRAKRLEQ